MDVKISKKLDAVLYIVRATPDRQKTRQKNTLTFTDAKIDGNQ